MLVDVKQRFISWRLTNQIRTDPDARYSKSKTLVTQKVKPEELALQE